MNILSIIENVFLGLLHCGIYPVPNFVVFVSMSTLLPNAYNSWSIRLKQPWIISKLTSSVIY